MRQRQAEPGLQSKFQDSQGYTEKPYLEKQNKTKQNKTQMPSQDGTMTPTNLTTSEFNVKFPGPLGGREMMLARCPPPSTHSCAGHAHIHTHIPYSHSREINVIRHIGKQKEKIEMPTLRHLISDLQSQQQRFAPPLQ